jgi:hypothetical protein
MVAIYGLPLLACHFWQGRLEIYFPLTMLIERWFNDDEACFLQLRQPSGDRSLPGIVQLR